MQKGGVLGLKMAFDAPPGVNCSILYTNYSQNYTNCMPIEGIKGACSIWVFFSHLGVKISHFGGKICHFRVKKR